MEKGNKGSTLTRMSVSGWMFLLVPAYPGCPGQTAVKWLLLLLLICTWNNFLASADFQILNIGVLPTVAVAYYVKWVFWRLLICFVIKLENVQAVNYVQTTVEWGQWRCCWFWLSIIPIWLVVVECFCDCEDFSVKIKLLNFKMKFSGHF